MVKNNYPIILAHGIARPDYLIDSIFTTLNLSLYDFSFVSDRFHYFKGIASFLRKHGIEVYHTRVSFAADVDTRARDLKKGILKILQKTGHKKVHIIGHSMGGLDARHMIVNEDMANKIASLTTIGTPHLGTFAAEWVIEQGIHKILGAFRRVINLDGIRSISVVACEDFNETVMNDEAANPVVYYTYASWQTQERTFLPFQITWKMIYEKRGANDGLVALDSQRWTDKLIADNGITKIVQQFDFPIPADHLEQVGWWNLNELHKAGWWNMKALHEKNEHEEIIKNVYLDIANEVQNNLRQRNGRLKRKMTRRRERTTA